MSTLRERAIAAYEQQLRTAGAEAHEQHRREWNRKVNLLKQGLHNSSLITGDYDILTDWDEPLAVYEDLIFGIPDTDPSKLILYVPCEQCGQPIPANSPQKIHDLDSLGRVLFSVDLYVKANMDYHKSEECRAINRAEADYNPTKRTTDERIATALEAIANHFLG